MVLAMIFDTFAQLAAHLADLPWSFLADGLLVSVRICVVAFALGLLGGLALALMSLTDGGLRLVARFYVSVFRSVPLIMVLLWFFLIVPDLVARLSGGTVGDVRLLSAISGFALFEAAYCGEILRTGIQSISNRQMDAARSLGMSWLQSMRLVILPQAWRKTTPLLLTQAIILFQDTSLVYIISLTDFFGAAYRIGERDGRMVALLTLAGVSYFLICFALSKGVGRIQHLKSVH